MPAILNASGYLVAFAAGALFAYAAGFLAVRYAFRRAKVVQCMIRCAKGHHFEGTWIVDLPMRSLIRPLRRRVMYCPVGRHRTWCAPTDPAIWARVEASRNDPVP